MLAQGIVLIRGTMPQAVGDRWSQVNRPFRQIADSAETLSLPPIRLQEAFQSPYNSHLQRHYGHMRNIACVREAFVS